MCRSQIDLRRAALVMGLQKPRRAKAPAVPSLKPCKPLFRARGREVIADIFRIGEEFVCHDRTDSMAALIGGTGVTGPVAEEACERLCAAGDKGLAINIDAGICFHITRLQVFSDGAKHFYISAVHTLVAKAAIRAVGYDYDVPRVIDIDVLAIDAARKILSGAGV